jgi:hypothetical protein
LDVFEINCIVKDVNGIISHCGVKGYGVQPIAIIDKLIREDVCSFFTYDGEKKRKVYARTISSGAPILTTDPSGSDINGLNILPLFDGPFVRQLIESVR